MAISPILIPIQVQGVRDVGKAMRSIEDILTSFERRQQARVSREQAAIDKTLQVKERAAAKAVAIADRTAEREVKAAEKAAMAKTRAEERELAKQLNARDQHERRVIARNQAAVKRDEENQAKARTRAREHIGGLIGRGVVNGVSQAGRLAAGALSIAGGFGIADAVQSRVSERGEAANIALSGSKTGGKPFTSQQVLGSATAVGISSGLGTKAALEGLEVFTSKTGDLQMGMNLLKDISVYADASGTSLKDMSSASAELFTSGTVKTGEELKGILGSIIEMGKDGAVEIKDLAAGFGRITASAGQFVGDKNQNVRSLTAFAEMSKQYAAASPREALTSVQNLASDLAKHKKGFAALAGGGVNVMDKGGKFLRDPMEILKETMMKTGGLSVPQQHSLFGERSFRAIAGASEIFNTAKAGGSTNEQAWGKVQTAFSDITAHILSYDQAQADAATRRAEADRKFASAMEDLKSKVGDQLLPVFVSLIPQLARLTPQLVSLAGAAAHLAEIFTEHPWAGLGLVVGGFIVKELALAFAAAGIKTAFTSASGAAASAGIGGSTAAVLPVAAAALAAASIGAGAYDVATTGAASYDAGASTALGGANTMKALARRISSGKASAAEIAAGKGQMAKLQGQLGWAKGADTGVANSFFSGVLATAESGVSKISDPLGIKAPTGRREESAAIAQAQGLKDNSKELEDALKALTEAIKTGTVAAAPRMGDLKHSEGMAQRGGTQ